MGKIFLYQMILPRDIHSKKNNNKKKEKKRKKKKKKKEENMEPLYGTSNIFYLLSCGPTRNCWLSNLSNGNLLLSKTWIDINREYYMALSVSHLVSTRDTNITPRVLARGLIRDVKRKEPYHIMFIIYLNMRKSCSALWIVTST